MSAKVWIATLLYLASSILVGAGVDIWRVEQTWRQIDKMEQKVAELKALRTN